ncbi:hypothetical protein IW150_004698 [Coemansia sp. RSA 2607]|nr:hypothetical protein IW150_004698 [Coemansia sp. RSA 2607]
MDSSAAGSRDDGLSDAEAAPRSRDPQPAYPEPRPPSQTSEASQNASIAKSAGEEAPQPPDMDDQAEAAEPGTRVSWQCSEAESQLVVRRTDSLDGQSIGGATAGRHSATSSLYGGSASLGGFVGTAGAAASGTLSPQYTLVNSDGASMRVHTGSIRERHMHRRISAIHEDDSDAAYPVSRRSDSLNFAPESSRASSEISRRHRSRHLAGDSALLAGAAAAAAVAEALGEGDCFSVLSGVSEGGASTTRVRMATDRAYDALRIGPGAAAFGYNVRRPMSFATSSDPGLPSAGSFCDYYLGADDYAPNSGSTRDGYAASDSDSDQPGDIASLVRSDVAVYSGAGDDVKFPFLPDNFSEFSGSLVYSPGGLSADAARMSRDPSEYSFVSPAHHHYGFAVHDAPQPPQMSLFKRGKAAEGAVTAATSSEPPVQRAGNSTLQRVSKRPGDASGPSNFIGLHRRYNSRRYRNQSAGHAYTSAVVEAVAATVRSTPTSPNAPDPTTQPLQAPQQPSPNPTQASHRLRSSTTAPAAIRPNAIVRFFKRITPKS